MVPYTFVLIFDFLKEKIIIKRSVIKPEIFLKQKLRDEIVMQWKIISFSHSKYLIQSYWIKYCKINKLNNLNVSMYNLFHLKSNYSDSYRKISLASFMT